MKNFIIAAVLAASSSGLAVQAQVKEHPVPRLVENDGRYALLVDGAPFLMLGAQSNNSSDWPATLPEVWPAIEYLHANTLETPIYWEQFEPQQGQFDYSEVDRQAKPLLQKVGSQHDRQAHRLPAVARLGINRLNQRQQL